MQTKLERGQWAGGHRKEEAVIRQTSVNGSRATVGSQGLTGFSKEEMWAAGWTEKQERRRKHKEGQLVHKEASRS